MSEAKKPTKSARLRALLPEVWALILPRRGLLVGGFFIMLVNRLSGLVLPASTRWLVDDVIGRRNVELLVPLVTGVALATAVQGVTSYALTQILSKEAQRTIAELRRTMQAHVGRLPVSFFDSQKTGALVARIMNDVEGVRNIVGSGLVEFAGGVITALAALALMLWLSPVMTGVTVLALTAVAGVLWKALSHLGPIFRERGKIYGDVTGRLTETLGGARVVKAYRAEPREEGVFAAGVQRLLDNILRTLTATSILSLASSVLMGVIGALAMYVGAKQILAGHLTVGGFFTYTLLLAFLVAPILQIIGIGTQLTEAGAGLERMREILSQAKEDADPRRTVVLPPINGRFVFEDVDFAYEPATPVLHGVSFVAEPGTVTALVGPSGAGKSTIIGLVAAFHVPTRGTIRVDGFDLSTLALDSYRSFLGAVLQETFLFDGTIRENVLFARPQATGEQVEEACRIARVDEFASRFELGLETVVGERGVKLSGGQRQRVSIARALLADPRVLILDEATSSLDSESEALIQDGLAHLMRGRTTFVIAHRLSTIRRAEQILVVEGGRVVERGTHGTLLALRGRYFEMYTRQHGLQANLFLAEGEEEQPAEALPPPEPQIKPPLAFP